MSTEDYMPPPAVVLSPRTNPAVPMRLSLSQASSALQIQLLPAR